MKRATEAVDPRTRTGERGAVIVELALMMPLLVVLLVTIVDLGLVLREYQVVQNAAREGARYSIHPSNWINWRNPTATEASIKARTIEYLQQEGIAIDPASVTVSQTRAVPVNGLTLYASEIRVTYDHTLLLPGLGVLPSPTVRLTGNAVFRNLY